MNKMVWQEAGPKAGTHSYRTFHLFDQSPNPDSSQKVIVVPNDFRIAVPNRQLPKLVGSFTELTTVPTVGRFLHGADHNYVCVLIGLF